jgi:hypothetical protein
MSIGNPRVNRFAMGKRSFPQETSLGRRGLRPILGRFRVNALFL